MLEILVPTLCCLSLSVHNLHVRPISVSYIPMGATYHLNLLYYPTPLCMGALCSMGPPPLPVVIPETSRLSGFPCGQCACKIKSHLWCIRPISVSIHHFCVIYSYWSYLPPKSPTPRSLMHRGSMEPPPLPCPVPLGGGGQLTTEISYIIYIYPHT